MGKATVRNHGGWKNFKKSHVSIETFFLNYEIVFMKAKKISDIYERILVQCDPM